MNSLNQVQGNGSAALVEAAAGDLGCQGGRVVRLLVAELRHLLEPSRPQGGEVDGGSRGDEGSEVQMLEVAPSLRMCCSVFGW